MPISIVASAPLRIADHAVSSGDLFEALLGAWVVRVLIGVVFGGELAVRFLDLFGVGVAPDAEDLIGVLAHDLFAAAEAFTHHRF